MPSSWATPDHITVTAETDLDFGGFQTNYSTASLIYAGVQISGSVYNGKLTFTSEGRKNYTFSNISQIHNPSPNAAPHSIIIGSDISFTEVGNLVFSGGNGNQQGINTHRSSLSFSNTGDISFSKFTTSLDGGAIFSWSETNSAGVQFNNTGNISFTSNTANGGWGGGAILSNNIEFNQINGNILFHDNHALSQSGGALHSNLGAAGGVISFSNVTGNITFSNNTAVKQGGAIYTTNPLSFDNITGNIVFSSNSSKECGGAISAWSDTKSEGIGFSNTGSISFISNSTDEWGGAIVSNNVEFDQINGNILFHDNHAMGDAGGAIASFGGAEGEISFSNVSGSVIFTENTAGLYQGGAIGTNKNVSFDNIQGGILFSDNNAVSDGGAISAYNPGTPCTISFTNIGTGIEFSNNESGANGGAIATNLFMLSNVTGNIVFSENKTQATGGAIYAANGLVIDEVQGNITFLNNHAGYDAGAILLGEDSESIIRATGGNILFSGNTCADNGINVPNSISMGSRSTLDIIAETGRTITFHDPITGGTSTTINLNGNEDSSTNGSIVFSGKSATNIAPIGADESQEDYQARLRHARCYFAQNISQYGGVVSLEDSAVLEADILYIANDSLLKLGENTLVTASFFTRSDSARISISQGASIQLHVGDLDLSQGVDVNLASFLSDNSASTTLTFLNDGQLNLGGMINLVDESGQTYSGSSYLSKDRNIAIIHDASSARGETDFEGIANSEQNGYGYQGTWSLAWQDDTLFAQWKVANYHTSPEQIGTSGVNSLWSSASNLQSLTDSSLAQTTRYRLISPQKSNYWVSGLGDFSSQRTVRGINGYDYQGGGYAVGGDHKVTDDTIVGLGFGQIFGKNQSRTYSSNIDQKSIMGMIYAAKRVELNKTNALRINLSAAFGSTDNKMTTRYAQGGLSHANWDNQAYGVNARIMWDISLQDGWTVSPFVGLEYTRVNEDDFTEGGTMARRIKGAHLGTLSLPVGVSLENLTSLANGMKWENTGTLAYRGDVYRKNPESQVSLVSDPHLAKWTSKGSKPARNAVEASILSRLHINDAWNVYAGYSVEARNNGIDQTGSIGVGLTF